MCGMVFGVLYLVMNVFSPCSWSGSVQAAEASWWRRCRGLLSELHRSHGYVYIEGDMTEAHGSCRSPQVHGCDCTLK